MLKLKKQRKTKKEACTCLYMHYRSVAVLLILRVHLSYSVVIGHNKCHSGGIAERWRGSFKVSTPARRVYSATGGK